MRHNFLLSCCRAANALHTTVFSSYPATRSAPYIDALMGDLIVAPPELRHSAYGERIIDMPYSYHVTDQASVRCFQNSN